MRNTVMSMPMANVFKFVEREWQIYLAIFTSTECTMIADSSSTDKESRRILGTLVIICHKVGLPTILGIDEILLLLARMAQEI